MAEYLSIGPVDTHTAMWIRDAARKEKLPTIANLDNPEFFPYRWGQALWAFIGGRWGDSKVAQIYRDALRSNDLDVALKNATGFNAKDLSSEWHTAIHAQYDPILKANAKIGTFARNVTESDKEKLAMNVSPSLSPDGKRIIYFSSRDMLSIGLFLAMDSPTSRAHAMKRSAAGVSVRFFSRTSAIGQGRVGNSIGSVLML